MQTSKLDESIEQYMQTQERKICFKLKVIMTLFSFFSVAAAFLFHFTYFLKRKRREKSKKKRNRNSNAEIHFFDSISLELFAIDFISDLYHSTLSVVSAAAAVFAFCLLPIATAAACRHLFEFVLIFFSK